MRYYTLLATLLLTACSLDIPVENEMTDPNALTGIQSASELLSTAYSRYPTDFLELSVLAEDFVPQSYAGNDPYLLHLYYYHDLEMMTFATSLWESYYAGIVQINALLEREEMLRERLASSDEDLAQFHYLLGEAETLKASCYLDLLRLFATPYDDTGRPEGIVLKDQTLMTRPARASKEECVREITALLDRAEANFAKCLASKTIHGAVPGFCSPETTRAVRARLLLYTGDLEGVLRETSKLPTPSVITTPERWAVASGEDGGTALFRSNTFYNNAYDSNPVASQMKYALSEALSFSPEDLRSQSYSVCPTGRSYQVLGKYCLARFRKVEIRSCFLIRPQELLFVRAEALARNGQEKEAIETVNTYLASCHAPVIDPMLSGEALIDAILREKAQEMVGENTNYLDLVRLHRPIRRYEMMSSSVRREIAPDDYHRTLPIPYSEIKNNSSMVQNQGWPTNIQKK